MRCYFHLVNDHEIIPDEEGVEILDLERARDFALQGIAELREEAIQVGSSWQGWRIDVVCSAGNVLLSIPLDPMFH
jgi:hypothetical protein